MEWKGMGRGRRGRSRMGQMGRVAILFPPNLGPEAPPSPYVQTAGSGTHVLPAQPVLCLRARFPPHEFPTQGYCVGVSRFCFTVYFLTLLSGSPKCLVQFLRPESRTQCECRTSRSPLSSTYTPVTKIWWGHLINQQVLKRNVSESLKIQCLKTNIKRSSNDFHHQSRFSVWHKLDQDIQFKNFGIQKVILHFSSPTPIMPK